MARSRSEAARAGWEARWEAAWERGDERGLGPKGREYLEKQYAEVYGEEPPDDIYDDYDSPYDLEVDY